MCFVESTYFVVQCFRIIDVYLLEGDDNKNTEWLDPRAIDSIGRSWKNVIFVGVAKLSLDPLIPTVFVWCLRAI